MIDKKCFTKEWIEEVKGSERSSQNIIEKQIYALHLLEELFVEFQMFIFKGGTALSLVADNFSRFSIDIDILVSPKDKEFFSLENLFRIVEHSEFSDVKENSRQPKHNIDKQHFEFYYDGPFSEGGYILLDIVYADSHYENVVSLEIRNHLIESNGDETKVLVPSIHDLLSDKLCAFAPHTTGKKLGEGRDVEIIKQMYDVSYLFEHYPLKPTLHQIYEPIAAEEIKSRELDINFEDCLIDTIRTSLNIISEGKIDNDEYKVLRVAINNFRGYVRDQVFRVDTARVCAIRVLRAATLVLTLGQDEFNRILADQNGYLEEYGVFKSSKAWLRATSSELYNLFDDTLKVLTNLEISLR